MLIKGLSHVYIILMVLRYLHCERRIIDGRKVTTKKRYMVYLTQAESTRNYDAWLCGGAIIHRWFILTSAACVEDVQNMYAIAGYEKYVSPKDLNKDKCTKHMKRRIIYICIPEAYDLKYDKIEKWSKLDIAMAKVEKPYKMDDRSFVEYCSYIPGKIDVNFELTYQAADTDVIVLGWGHTSTWRKPKDKTDYNHKTLLYASTKIFAKIECMKFFKNPNLSDLIDKYMICTEGEGGIDESGQLYMVRRRKIEDFLNEKSGKENFNSKQQNFTETQNNLTSLMFLNETRRQGICQNDHGGPLVGWVYGKELVFGVASLFRLNEDSKCIPPFLYTSTAHNKLFIECVLNTEKKGRRSSICDKPASEKGFNIIFRHVSWVNHDDGNTTEQINIRPQIPMHYFQEGK